MAISTTTAAAAAAIAITIVNAWLVMYNNNHNNCKYNKIIGIFGKYTITKWKGKRKQQQQKMYVRRVNWSTTIASLHKINIENRQIFLFFFFYFIRLSMRRKLMPLKIEHKDRPHLKCVIHLRKRKQQNVIVLCRLRIFFFPFFSFFLCFSSYDNTKRAVRIFIYFMMK